MRRILSTGVMATAEKLKRRPKSAISVVEMELQAERLSKPKRRPSSPTLYHPVNRVIGGKKLSSEAVQEIVERLSSSKPEAVPDARRVGADKEMGIMNSFAWQGW